MCGLTGILDLGFDRKRIALEDSIHNMAATMVHRGPDDEGTWCDVEAGAALGFRRLAIIDLSEAGHQPMHSASGRYVMVFNGEVYNSEALRRELVARNAAPLFRGHSDTEIMLAAIEAWGLEPAVQRFIGMFAIALWDRQERVLHLVRDRLGVKPLYYGWAGKTFLFGSELKALRAHVAFNAEIDRNALALYTRHNYIPAPYTIYQGFYKLLPGSILSVPADKVRTPKPVPYWSARAVAEHGVAAPFEGTDRDAIEQLDALLRDSIGLRMVADVPLGVFLSGGIDSSVVTALMQVQSSRPVQTFTIGFREDRYNEAVFAKDVACHLGTEHTELYVTPEEAMAVIPRMPCLYDEPFSDSSQIPTFLVSELARRDVTVSLSGDGGDELFGGYNRYFWGRSIWDRMRHVPKPMRRAATSAILALSPDSWEKVFRAVEPVLPRRLRVGNPAAKMSALGNVLGAESPDEMYRWLVSHEKQPTALVCDSSEPSTVLTERAQWADLPEFVQRMMYLDLMTYLPDDILVKVDRATMGVSLEAREPLLDHRLVEFAWRLPGSMKIRNGQGKWLLRQVLYKYVPETLIDRPKMGFGVPIGNWLRGPLRDWAEALLDENRLRQEGYLQPEPIRKKWQEHLSGRIDWQYYLWDILMFEAWLEANRR